MKTGIELIAQERKEQIEKHGRSVESDVRSNNENQLLSGIMMLVSNIVFNQTGMDIPDEAFEDLRPDGWSITSCRKMMSKDAVGQLKVIGAFAAAEIDRLQYGAEG